MDGWMDGWMDGLSCCSLAFGREREKRAEAKASLALL